MDVTCGDLNDDDDDVVVLRGIVDPPVDFFSVLWFESANNSAELNDDNEQVSSGILQFSRMGPTKSMWGYKTLGVTPLSLLLR